MTSPLSPNLAVLCCLGINYVVLFLVGSFRFLRVYSYRLGWGVTNTLFSLIVMILLMRAMAFGLMCYLYRPSQMSTHDTNKPVFFVLFSAPVTLTDLTFITLLLQLCILYYSCHDLPSSMAPFENTRAWLILTFVALGFAYGGCIGGMYLLFCCNLLTENMVTQVQSGSNFFLVAIAITTVGLLHSRFRRVEFRSNAARQKLRKVGGVTLIWAASRLVYGIVSVTFLLPSRQSSSVEPLYSDDLRSLIGVLSLFLVTEVLPILACIDWAFVGLMVGMDDSGSTYPLLHHAQYHQDPAYLRSGGSEYYPPSPYGVPPATAPSRAPTSTAQQPRGWVPTSPSQRAVMGPPSNSPHSTATAPAAMGGHRQPPDIMPTLEWKNVVLMESEPLQQPPPKVKPLALGKLVVGVLPAAGSMHSVGSQGSQTHPHTADAERGAPDDGEPGRKVVIRIIDARRLSRYISEEIRLDFMKLLSLTHPNLLQVKELAEVPTPQRRIWVVYPHLPGCLSLYTLLHTDLPGDPMPPPSPEDSPARSLPESRFSTGASGGHTAVSTGHGSLTAPKTLKAKLQYVRQVVSCLVYLHNEGRPHGHLTSHNVIVSPTHRAYLTDLGFHSLKRFLAVLGVYEFRSAWSAPEILSGECRVFTAETDVYSLGILIWEVCTSIEPFGGSNIQTIRKLVVEGKKRPELPASIPKDLAGLVRSCWQDAPEKRPTMSAVLRALDSIMDNMRS
ncbi:unnamed protein product [Vitrella brassicaformis CCMP3155]|uniref:Protein kinase domain-containing protein n=2 Tax=Vitrella brassicaformis TaxID=1169539 RepID=A0A0G4FFL3_VITBC|nr:unnamed protein product [Vitrella brassicaformis CCMP3155]|eukprot:CEM12005.1 unnamed protein product [Vitrella brassicaformis CCMP3155]